VPAPTIFSQEYINKCFNQWYLSGRPVEPRLIRKILPEHESGRLPSVRHIKRWVIDGAWDIRADELDAKVHERNDIELVNTKAQMLKEHLEQAKQVTMEALSYITKEGFDSSSAAVSAFYKGLEEQRKTQGFSDLLERLDKMTNNDVEREIIEKLRRIQENDQIIETDAEDIHELEDGE
jgi:hypothetical protein